MAGKLIQAAAGLKHVEIPVPAPGNGEILIKIEAASINPIDWKIQKGIGRPIFPKKFPYVPEHSFSSTTNRITKIDTSMGDLYALDFDGVLCDSCGESSISAVKAAKLKWPELFETVDSSMEDWIVDQMHTVRPIVETGYENLLLVRLLLEIMIPSLQTSSVAKGLTIKGILENWSGIKPVIMEEWGENKDELIDLFGKVRDDWMENDLATWVGANRFYPGVPDALKFASSELYIVTTKQGRFADALLRELAGITIPPERIYALGSGPKVEVLKMLQKRPEHQGLTLHFVEDRLATLKNVIKEPELNGWNLYLGDWGYNTQKEREEATTYSRIQVLQLSDFSKKLK